MEEHFLTQNLSWLTFWVTNTLCG